MANSDFGHVTYTEAIEILEKHNDKFEYKVSWGVDLQTEHERYLTRGSLQETGIRYRLSEGDQGLLHEA